MSGKASIDAALAHAHHQDEARTVAIAAFNGKPVADSFSHGGKPASATNVAPIAGPVPGSQWAPAVPGPNPGAALAQANNGPTRVTLAEPAKLVTPVLITAQGNIAVHDAELIGAMSGLMGHLATIAGHTASLPAIAESCAAIAAKDFSPKITVQGGGAGPAGAFRERASFSD